MTAPRSRRRPVAAQVELSDGQRAHLLKGFDFVGKGYGREPTGEGLERMRSDWKRYRDELLREWIAEHPGTRPAAWWTFDAPARRETIDGSIHPFDRPERRARCEKWHAEHPTQGYDRLFWELYDGRPRIVVGEGLVRYESQRQYLARLGLLMPAEREQLSETTTPTNERALA